MTAVSSTAPQLRRVIAAPWKTMAYQEYLSPGTLAVELGPRDLFEAEDVTQDGEQPKMLDERILDCPLDAADAYLPASTKPATTTALVGAVAVAGAGWPDFAAPDKSMTDAPQARAVMRPHHPAALTFRTPPESWESGSCTPTPVYDGVAPDYDGAGSASYWPGSAGAIAAPTPFDMAAAHEHHPMAPFAVPISADASMPTSPMGEWSSSAVGGADPLGLRAVPTRPRPGSPSSPHSPLLRRDGIRKKNARFEIPAERNLLNIDRLISQSHDEREIKELKQQKRLLRNRQAALDSRQRKKQHTERLEEEKKHYTNIISELEDACAQLRIREADHARREEEWKAQQQRYEHFIEGLQLEKEEMIRRHTIETGDLRKKNAVLAEHVQKMDGTAMSAMPSSSGFSADFSDVDGLGLGFGVESGSFEPYSILHDFSLVPDLAPRPDQSLALVSQPRKSEHMPPPPPPPPPPPADNRHDLLDEKPAASGFLLLLLLCGAFVASKSSTTSTPTIPRLPEDMRAASATVLDNIFRDAGVEPQEASAAQASGRTEALEPMPSSSSAANLAWPSMSAHADKNSHQHPHDMVGLTASSLDVLQRQLIQPSKAQQEEQLFTLTPDQYNGIVSPAEAFSSSMEMMHGPAAAAAAAGPGAPMSQGRRDLGAGLAAMRDRQKALSSSSASAAAAAEVYTRSLLWDKVPAEVVRDFARFVAQSSGGMGPATTNSNNNNPNNHQHNNGHHHHNNNKKNKGHNDDLHEHANEHDHDVHDDHDALHHRHHLLQRPKVEMST